MDNKIKTIASVESLTGGLFAATITKRPKASRYFKGSLVAYHNEIKEKLGVDTSNGVVNALVAQQMAIKGKEFFGVDYCLSFTGNAGPSVLDNEGVGVVFIALNDRVYRKEFKGDREEIQKQCVGFGISLLKNVFDFTKN